MMKSQVEQARDKLFSPDGLDVKNIKLFPGSSRDVTAEQIAEQVNKALAQLEAGDYEMVDQLPD
jgi:hypothetical protein